MTGGILHKRIVLIAKQNRINIIDEYLDATIIAHHLTYSNFNNFFYPLIILTEERGVQGGGCRGLPGRGFLWRQACSRRNGGLYADYKNHYGRNVCDIWGTGMASPHCEVSCAQLSGACV